MVASLEDFKRRIDVWKGRFESLKDRRNFLKDEVQNLYSSLSETKGAVSLLQFVAAEVSKFTEKQTADVASVALKDTFPDQQLSLVVKHSSQRGHSGVEFFLKDDLYDVEDDPMEAFGGGPASLIGLVLQVICTVRQEGMVRVLILDEPFSQISVEYETLAGRLLRKICDSKEQGGLDFKMLVVTHSNAIAEAAHKRYHADKTEEGKVFLTKIEG